MFWVSSFPLIRYTRSDRREAPFLPLYTGIFFLAYGLPTFGEGVAVHLIPLETDLVVRSATVAVVAECVFLFGYYFLGHWCFRRIPTLRLYLDLQRSVPRLMIGAIIFSTLGIIFHFLAIPQELAQAANTVADLGLLCASGLFLAWLQNRLFVTGKIVVLASVGAIVYIQLGTGALAGPMKSLLILMIVFAFEKRRFPIGAFAVVIALAIPLNASKSAFRELTWFRENTNNPYTLTVTFVRISMQEFLNGELMYSEASEIARSRVDHLGTLAWVMELTPEKIPYWNGATYLGMPWSFIPRILVPEKPVQTYGQEFGHRYELLDRSDKSTSYNLEQLVELYINFGTMGMLAGMVLLGLLYRTLVRFLAVESEAVGSILIGAKILVGLLMLESNFVLVHGFVLQVAIIQYFFLQILGATRNLPKSKHSLEV